MTLAQVYKMDIFNILKQDTDDVILIINYFIEMGDSADAPAPAPKKKEHDLDEFWQYV